MNDNDLLDFIEKQPIEELKKNHNFLIEVSKRISKKMGETNT